jgi:hypothetical protein
LHNSISQLGAISKIRKFTHFTEVLQSEEYAEISTVKDRAEVERLVADLRKAGLN